MLEKAQFSLTRAGVMTGLCAVVFLLGGVFSKPPQENEHFSPTHINERNFKRLQLVLRHIAPANVQSSNSLSPQTNRCTSELNSSWIRTVDLLNAQLELLHREQFLNQAYSLNLAALVSDPDIVGMPCKELHATVNWLVRQGHQQGSHFWYGLSWNERSPPKTKVIQHANGWVAMPKSMLTSRSPWGGLSGCLFWRDSTTGQLLYSGKLNNPVTEFCTQQASHLHNEVEPRVIDSELQLSSSAIVNQFLAPLRQPFHSDFSKLVEPHHVVKIRGQEIPVGLHVQLSFDPRWQNDLQKLLSCYTQSNSSECQTKDTKGETRYENARVRMAGLVVLDIPTGLVLVSASSDSPCAAHDVSRKGLRPTGCPDVPDGSVYRPHWPKELDNHGLFTQAQPGSLVKPLLYASILTSGGHYRALDSALQHSDSQQFLDAWLCRQFLRNGNFNPSCDRPKTTQHLAHYLGWNENCDAPGDMTSHLPCGFRDLLTGQSLHESQTPMPSMPVLSGHTLVVSPDLIGSHPSYVEMEWPQYMPSANDRLDCAESGKTGYTRCQGVKMGVISEGYGQGNTLTTPVGMAGLLAGIANIAYGQPIHHPSILSKVFRNDRPSPWVLNNPLNDSNSMHSVPRFSSEMAQQIIAAMSLTHQKTGTAYNACVEVWGSQSCQGDLGIAGKTGTPGDADNRSLKQLHEDMVKRKTCLAQHEKACDSWFPLPRPRYRWYGAMFKQAGSDRFDKVIVVLTQSNWRKADDRFADDQNAATEIGFRAIRLLRKLGATP